MDIDRNVETAKRQPNDEKERQIYRKERAKSSRFLDNYYNPKFHNKFFCPNGAFIVKRQYEYSRTGLSYFYEKQNVMYKLNVEDKEKKLKEKENDQKELLNNYVEFKYMDDNDIVIVIEHCANCKDHQTHTQHSDEFYKNFAKSIQNAIILRFPFIKVYLKPIDTDIIKNEESHVKSNDQNKKKAVNLVIDDKFKEVKIGAMEILLCVKNEEKKPNIIPLFSKLTSRKWPNIEKLLDSIMQYVPKFTLNINVYDRDSGMNEYKDFEEAKEDELSYSKYEHIKVNLYFLNSEKIKEICFYANEEIENLLNPKRKLLSAINNRKDMQSTNTTSNNLNFTSRPTTSFPPKLRPLTGITDFNQQKKVNNTNSGFANFRPNSTNLAFNSNFSKLNTQSNFEKDSNNKEIEDQDKLNSLKGVLIRREFSNKKGWVSFENLPYDSYLIEIEESKNFLVNGSIFKLNKILENKVVKRYFGLRRQINSYADVYIYFNAKKNSNEPDNMQLIEGAEVYLKRIRSQNEFGYPEDDSDSKFLMKENKKFKGRYQQVLTPGNYLVEVMKKGYEISVKEFQLSPGEMKINIELFSEKAYKLKVSVYDYENFVAIENVKLNLLLPNNEILSEGLTDQTGTFLFETTTKDEYLTLVATKQSYFVGQRTFVKDVTNNKTITQASDKNEPNSNSVIDDNIIKELTVVLVKESLVMIEKSIIFISYSSLISDNFDPIFLYSDKISQNLEITCSDTQKDIGILTAQFKLNGNDNDEIKFQDFEEICRLMLRIKTDDLVKTYDLSFKSSLNGLRKYNCECALYTMNNFFFLSPPQFSRESKFEYWDLGFLDFKNHLFFELGQALVAPFEKEAFFFNEWMAFLDSLIVNKNYLKLFEIFGFNKGILTYNDRTISDALFLKGLKSIFTDNDQIVDFTIYLCDLMKINNGLISYSIFKRKVTSNLKNFKEIKINLSQQEKNMSI